MGNISYVASLCAIKHNNAIQMEIYSVIYTGDLTRYINGNTRNPEVSPDMTRILWGLSPTEVKTEVLEWLQPV